MSYPRTRNGWTDTGSLITASNRRDKCPNCGSADYRETLSMERCGACGLQCDYWGGGTNPVYEAYLQREHRAQQQEAEERQRREDEAEQAAWESMNDTRPPWYDD